MYAFCEGWNGWEAEQVGFTELLESDGCDANIVGEVLPLPGRRAVNPPAPLFVSS